MKKSKLLAVALVVAVMLMGAGYAYWSETLTINNTVKTGEMDVQFECINDNDYDNAPPRGYDYIDVDSYTVDNNHKIVFTLEDMYPGGGGWLKFKIRNTGTVPVNLKSITPTVKTEEVEGMRDVFNYKVKCLKLFVPVKFGPWEWEAKYTLYDPIEADNFQDFVNALESKLSQYTLEPYAYWEINAEGTGYDIQVPSTVEDDKYEEKSFEFDLSLNFEQAH